MNTNKFIVSLFVLGAVSVAYAQDVYEDDIYCLLYTSDAADER